MEVAGIYRLDYQGIQDPSGNEAEVISRWVEVFDITPPVMTLYGADHIMLMLIQQMFSTILVLLPLIT